MQLPLTRLKSSVFVRTLMEKETQKERRHPANHWKSWMRMMRTSVLWRTPLRRSVRQVQNVFCQALVKSILLRGKKLKYSRLGWREVRTVNDPNVSLIPNLTWIIQTRLCNVYLLCANRVWPLVSGKKLFKNQICLKGFAVTRHEVMVLWDDVEGCQHCKTHLSTVMSTL